MNRFTRHGLVVDYAIHGNKGNPHAHRMVPLRRVEGRSFSNVKESSRRGESSLFDRKGLIETNTIRVIEARFLRNVRRPIKQRVSRRWRISIVRKRRA